LKKLFLLRTLQPSPIAKKGLWLDLFRLFLLQSAVTSRLKFIPSMHLVLSPNFPPAAPLLTRDGTASLKGGGFVFDIIVIALSSLGIAFLTGFL